MRFAMILFAFLAISFVNADDGDDILQSFLDEKPAECMTVLSRVYWETGFVDAVGKEFLKQSKRLLKISSHLSYSPSFMWKNSSWGKECDPEGEVLDRVVRMGYSPVSSMSAQELEFMAKLTEHRELDEDKTGKNELKNMDMRDMLNNKDADIPVPSSWVWQDYVLICAGVPMTLAMMGLAYKAFL